MSAQQIFPMLSYADARNAIEFLCQAFGFEERMRYEMPDGKIGHAELACESVGDGEGAVIMLADEYPAFGFASPHAAATVPGQLYVRVPDVDAHYRRAIAAGAIVVGEPVVDHGDRFYRAIDCEGHRWMFAQPDESAPAPGASTGSETS